MRIFKRLFNLWELASGNWPDFIKEWAEKEMQNWGIDPETHKVKPAEKVTDWLKIRRTSHFVVILAAIAAAAILAVYGVF